MGWQESDMTSKLFAPAVVLAAATLAATPVFAGQHEHGRDHGRSEGQAVQRGNTGRSVAPRAEAPRQAAAPRVEAVPPRVQSVAPHEQAVAPRMQTVAPRVQAVAPPVQTRGSVVVGHAVPRAVAPPAYGYAPRAYGYAPRAYGYGPRVYGPVYYGYRPYAFYPRSRVSFGIYLGFGVPYAYAWSYPVPVYGYGAPAAPVYITPGSTVYGGLALQITPEDADVVVDGQFVGQVHDFDGQSAPLNLTAGRHHVELNARGYQQLAFDVDVQPGQLVPYRGDMQPLGY
jgi:hypothetical protein